MNLASSPDSRDDLADDSDLLRASEDGEKQRNMIKEGDSKVMDQSWVKAVMDKKQLRKYEVEVSNKDGVHMVEIPDEVLENTTPLWEDFVVGKFLDLAPHVAKVHMVLNKIWKYGDSSTKVEVFEVNATTMRFKVSSRKAREKILRRGMWNIVGVPMIVSKWTPEAEGEDQKEEAIPMWVHLEKVPLHMYSWEGLSFITSTVGIPVKPHPETIACTNLNEAKIFARVDVTKILPKEITFSKDGKQFTVKFYYPWLPARCKFCDKWGHNEAVCAMKSKGKKSRNNTGSPAIKGTGDKAEQSSPLSVVKEKEEEIMRRNSETNMDVAVSEGSAKKSENGVGTSVWSTVSPAKTGRSLVLSAKQIDDVEISASKFSVLSIDDAEEGEILEVEKALNGVVDEQVETDEMESLECDHGEDIDQQVLEEKKVGLRRGRKAKAPDANPGKSSRPRRKH
ncbi:hypothetical protein Bca4012_055712 [Brassica carinata]